jgi:hypothetical protein
MNKTTVLKISGVLGFAVMASHALAIDIEPGLYQVWRSQTEVTSQQALGQPTTSICVTAATVRDPLILLGEKTTDAGCTATSPQRTNSVTSVFNVSCNAGQTSGTATAVKNGQKFATTLILRKSETVTKSFIYASRVAVCSK